MKDRRTEENKRMRRWMVERGEGSKGKRLGKERAEEDSHHQLGGVLGHETGGART